jgi:hypothetical protein
MFHIPNFMDMRFGTWHVRGLYRAGSLMTAVKEISQYKLHLVGVQEVRWDRGGTGPADKYEGQSKSSRNGGIALMVGHTAMLT